MRRRVPRLPDAYQEVNYIESTWTQYIDSWYTPNYNTEISCKFAHNENVIDTPVFWARTSGGGNQYVLWSHPIGYSAQWACQFNNTQSASFTSLSVGTEIEFSYDKTWWNYWSQSWTWSPASWTPNVNIIIFWLRQWTSIDNRKFAGKMWYFQISENWILKKNFVPCYRKSDSVIWMYDLVNDQFYTNAWSGTFTKGTDSSTLELKEFQVWPDEWWTLSWYRDFTTATKSALEWEWWGGQWWWSWSVSSSWLTTSRSTTDRSYMVSLPIQINTGAKSIRIYWVVNRSVGSWYGSFWWGIKATNTCGTGSSDYPIGDWLITQSVNCNNNSWYMWYGAGTNVLWFTGPGQWNTSNLWYSGSDVTVEATIDLDGGTCSCSYKSGSTTIWSWSTTFDSATVKATLSGLSTNQYLSIYNRNGTWNYKYMKNFGYEIIY